MIISHQYRFVQLAPWKTASSTMNLRLIKYNESPYHGFYDFNPYLRRVVSQHLTYGEYVMLPESRLGYFTAAFVRNPYDRVYSGFLQLQRDIQAQPPLPFLTAWTKPMVMRQIADNFAQLAAGEFDSNKWFRLVKEHQILEVGHNVSFPLYPAHYWTGIDGEQAVDFVGKVEQFEPDFERLCDLIGISPDGYDSANVSEGLPGDVDPDTPRYLSRMDAASISKINALFERDFEIFGYRKFGA
jgi:hypothetical protein